MPKSEIQVTVSYHRYLAILNVLFEAKRLATFDAELGRAIHRYEAIHEEESFKPAILELPIGNS
jgi:hypothetical protein